MGTWDVGPFDDDHAADWCGVLHDAAPADRILLIRAALRAVTDSGDDDYLDGGVAVEAVAAAAVVASQLPGGETVTSPYAPNFLLEGESLVIPGDLPALASRALDRVTADNSEWRDLWTETEHYPRVLAALSSIRSTLGRAGTTHR